MISAGSIIVLTLHNSVKQNHWLSSFNFILMLILSYLFIYLKNASSALAKWNSGLHDV